MSRDEDMMDFIQDNEEEDRISNLPDDIIHHIFSFIDMKYAVQTSALSRKWRNIWTTSPYLNLNTSNRFFGDIREFAKFVDCVLRFRDNHAGVSALQLQFFGPIHQPILEYVIRYVYPRKVRKLVIKWHTGELHELPSCHTLKQLTLECCTSTHLPKCALDFPALETLNLSGMYFYDTGVKNLNLFCKCVNLKNLMLSRFTLSGLDSFNICCPQLLNLTIKDALGFPNVFNVNAPQLKNVIAPVVATTYIGNRPATSFLQLSTEGFNFLETVDLSLQFHRSPCADMKQRFVPVLFKLFQDLRSAKFLFVNTEIIEILSFCSDQLLSNPCPFSNLKSLKVHNMKYDQGDYLSTIVTQIRNYWLKDCLSATPVQGGFSVVGKRETRLYEPEERLQSSSRGIKTGAFCSASRDAFIIDDVFDICLPLSKKLRII